jgi:hypothetical protein
MQRSCWHTRQPSFHDQYVCQPQQRVTGQVVGSPARRVRVVDESYQRSIILG